MLLAKHTYAKRRWPPQNESKWWLRWQARRRRRAETDANGDGPALLLSVRQRAGTSSSPQSSTPQPPSLSPNPRTAHGSFLPSHIMIPLFFQIEDPRSSQTAWPKLHVAHIGPMRSCWEAGGIQWCSLFAKSRAETVAITAVHYTIAGVIPSSQHPFTRTGSESFQLIYSRHELRALINEARQFQRQPIFWREFAHKEIM